MTYAEAVKRAAYIMKRGPWQFENIDAEALAVLRRAEPVMAAVEYCPPEPIAAMVKRAEVYDDVPLAILRESLRYKETQ